MSDKLLSKRPSTTQPKSLQSDNPNRPRTSHGGPAELPRLKGLKHQAAVDSGKPRRGSLFDGLPALQPSRRESSKENETTVKKNKPRPSTKGKKKKGKGGEKMETEDLITLMYGYKRYTNEPDYAVGPFGDNNPRCQPWSTTRETYNRVPTFFTNNKGKRKAMNAHVRVAKSCEYFCPRCDMYFRSLDDYHQHLIYVDMKMKLQAQIDIVLNRAGLPGSKDGGERFLSLPAARQSNMVGLHERTSRIATQYFNRQGATSVFKRPDRVESRFGVPKAATPKTPAEHGGGDGPKFTTDKKSRKYYSEEAAISEVLHLRHKLTFMIPDELIKREMSRINQKTKNSWEDLRSSIFDQSKTIENKLREIEAELAILMVNDPHNEVIGVIQRKYISQRQTLSTLRGEVRQNANDIRAELLSSIKRRSVFKNKSSLKSLNPLLEYPSNE